MENDFEKELENGTVDEGSVAAPKKRKKFLIPVIAVLVLVLGGAGFMLYRFVYVPYSQYTYAGRCIQEKKYDEAIKIYQELDGYKDSEEQIAVAYYEKGNALVAEEKYGQAAEFYRRAGSYSDAQQKLTAAEEDQAFQDLKQKLKHAFAECKSSDTSLSRDELSIMIDSKNQYDYEGAVDAITIMTKLGLPDSLLTEMTNTTALMGMQTRTYDNIEVSWSYHPDNGLDIIFRIQK